MKTLKTLAKAGVLAVASAPAVLAQDISTFGQGCADVFRVVTEFPDRNCEVECYDREWLTNAARNADANGDGIVIALPHGVYTTAAGETERYTQGRVSRLQPVLAGDLAEHGITAQWIETLAVPSQNGPSSVTIHFADNLSQMVRSGSEYQPARDVRSTGYAAGLCIRR